MNKTYAVNPTVDLYEERGQAMNEYHVHTGRPSWHQARAGAISAGVMVHSTKEGAEEYKARCLALRPTEPAFIVVVPLKGSKS